MDLIHLNLGGAGPAEDPWGLQDGPVQARDTQLRPRGPQDWPDAKSYEKGPKASSPTPRGRRQTGFSPAALPGRLLQHHQDIPRQGPSSQGETSQSLPAQEPEPAAKGVSAFLRLPSVWDQRSNWQRGAILAQKPAQRRPQPGRG